MSFVEQSGKQVVPLWIGGRAHASDPARFYPVTNARHNAIIHYAQGADESDARAAVEAAAAAFGSWRDTKHPQRRAILLRAVDILESRAEEIAQAQSRETSCSLTFARFLPRLAASVVREIAGSMSAALTGEAPPIEGEGYGFVMKEPVGPILCISPWNSPTILGLRGITSALAAGCTVVLKASELCPYTYRLLVDVLEQAGLPYGCLNQIQADREHAATVTETLIAHPAIRKIEFIGSAAIGSMIGQTAAKHLKPVLMELGGKGPALVLGDANLSKAAKACAFGAFLHHGQICFSTERIIVLKSIQEDFVKLLKAEVENFDGSAIGNAASDRFAQSAHSMLESAKANGAEFLVGDNTYSNDTKSSLKPTIVTGVKPTDKLRDQETFGPSASLYVVDNEDEAVRLANDSAYGLSAAIWSEDTMKALDMSRKLEFGQVHVNSTTVNDPSTLPVSGVKGSGWGDNNSHFGISEFLLNKTVTLHRSDEPIAFGT